MRVLALSGVVAMVAGVGGFWVKGMGGYGERHLVAWWPLALVLLAGVRAGGVPSRWHGIGLWGVAMVFFIFTVIARMNMPLVYPSSQTFLVNWLKTHPQHALVLPSRKVCYEIRTGLKPPPAGQSPFATHWLDFCHHPASVHGQMRRKPPLHGPYLLALLKKGARGYSPFHLPVGCQKFHSLGHVAYWLCGEHLGPK